MESRQRLPIGEQERQRSLELVIPGLNEAREKTDAAILEAEKFRATIAEPGKSGFLQNIGNIDEITHKPNIGKGVSDDDFFHLSCHIDPTLIHKIENGEFIELEKLLPKERFSKYGSEDNRLEWVYRDGNTFLVPAKKDVKINSFRR